MIICGQKNKSSFIRWNSFNWNEKDIVGVDVAILPQLIAYDPLTQSFQLLIRLNRKIIVTCYSRKTHRGRLLNSINNECMTRTQDPGFVHAVLCWCEFLGHSNGTDRCMM